MGPVSALFHLFLASLTLDQLVNALLTTTHVSLPQILMWAANPSFCNLQLLSSPPSLQRQCSNRGQCVCGTCECQVGYAGQFCERCTNSSVRAERQFLYVSQEDNTYFCIGKGAYESNSNVYMCNSIAFGCLVHAHNIIFMQVLLVRFNVLTRPCGYTRVATEWAGSAHSNDTSRWLSFIGELPLSTSFSPFLSPSFPP